MAFFKFQFPGQAAAHEALAAGPNENMEVARRRARHRLIGAVVLVLAAVVGFPLLFDTQPRPVAVDTPIVIPDRQSASPLSSPVPAAQAPAKPLLAASDMVSADASLGAREEVVAPAQIQRPEVKPAEVKPAAVVNQPLEKPVAPPQPKATAQAKTEKTAPTLKPPSDAEKALALLEGKSAKSGPVRLVIQVGAFSEGAKLREVRSKLEQAGLKTYTQVVDRDGKSTTRVRVGPFESREEADKAAARIRKLDLPAAVLKI